MNLQCAKDKEILKPFIFYKVEKDEYLIGLDGDCHRYKSSLIGLDAAYRCIDNPLVPIDCSDLTTSQYANNVLRNSIRNVAQIWFEKNVPNCRLLTSALFRIIVSGHCYATYDPANFSTFIKTKALT
jgi:hypothetical protein